MTTRQPVTPLSRQSRYGGAIATAAGQADVFLVFAHLNSGGWTLQMMSADPMGSGAAGGEGLSRSVLSNLFPGRFATGA